MTDVVFRDDRPTTASRVMRFEERFHLKLPSEYRNFLITVNGGYPEPAEILIPDDEDEKSLRIERLYGLDRREDEDIEWHLTVLARAIPDKTIPIGTTTGGIWVWLSLAKNDYGTIYSWAPPSFPTPATREYFFYLAGSFPDLLSKLFEPLDPDEPVFARILKHGTVGDLATLLRSGFDLNSRDEYDRTHLENAVIANRPDIVEMLFANGADLGKAMELALTNLEFFPEFATMVEVIKRLSGQCGSK